MTARRYLAILQDPQGYPPPGADLEPAPPEGPFTPEVFTVVRSADYEEAEKQRFTEKDALDLAKSLRAKGPQFYKDGFSLSWESVAARSVLQRHGYNVVVNDDHGAITVYDPEGETIR